MTAPKSRTPRPGLPSRPQANPAPKAQPAAPPAAHSTTVRLRWLLTALGLLLLAAAGCSYLTLCLLFVQGQWQLLYHPARAVTATPSSLGLAFDTIHFAPADTGATELSGWWLPAPKPTGSKVTPTPTAVPPTVLYLHDATGSLSDTLPELATLQALGCAVFAIDYRGFGASAPTHPSEPRMVEDGARAITYLLDTRHIPPASLVLWGRGVGATIAAEAAETPVLAPLSLRMVLEDVNPPALELLRNDPRTRLLPVRLLLRDHLDPGPALRLSSAPKLFLRSLSHAAKNPVAAPSTLRLYAGAAQPRQWANLPDKLAVQAFLATSFPTPR